MKKQIILLAGLLLLAACNRTPRGHQIKNLGDTPYQEDTIRMTYARNPERALALLDSAILLGNIDPYHALLARATPTKFGKFLDRPFHFLRRIL